MESDSESTCIFQQLNHTNPVKENRYPTNIRFVYVFLLIVFLWLVVGIQGFARRSTNEFDGHDLTNDKDHLVFVLHRYVNITLPYLSPPVETFDKVFLFSLFFGGISVSNCIIFIKIFTRPFVYISLLIFVISLLAGIGSIVTLALNLVINTVNIVALVFLSICLIYAITVLSCVYKTGLKTLCELVRNSTRVITECPAAVFFTFAIVVLEILVVVFGMNSLKIVLSSNDSTFVIIIFSLIIIIGSIVIGTFLIFFAIAVISEFTVNWFWTEDKKEISCGSFSRSVLRISRNHFGTIALESTLIVPIIYCIIRAIKYKNKSARSRNCGDIYIDSVARVTLVCTIVHSALVHTSIYGSNFVTATKKTMRLVISNSSLYLATTEIFNILAIIGVIGNTIVMFFTAYTIVRLKHIVVPNMPLPFFWGFYIPVGVYCILIISVGRALLMNKMIMLSAEKDVKENGEMV